MSASHTAVVQQHGAWWIGWIEEVPGVNSQGHGRDELLETCEMLWRKRWK